MIKVRAKVGCNDFEFTGLIPDEVYEATPLYNDDGEIGQYDINSLRYHVSHFYPQNKRVDVPKWVTSKVDTLCGLTKDEDYKVASKIGEWFKLEGEDVRLHESLFYSKEECLTAHKVEVLEEDESSFYNLVYVEPVGKECDYFYIPLSSLSEEQKDFLVEHLPTCPIRFKKDFGREDIIMTQFGEGEWWTNILGVCSKLHEENRISFNDIFVEKTSD